MLLNDAPRVTIEADIAHSVAWPSVRKRLVRVCGKTSAITDERKSGGQEHCLEGGDRRQFKRS